MTSDQQYSAKTHEEILVLLTQMPESEARHILIGAISKNCDSGFTLARAEVFQHHELVHQLYGCQNEKKCDTDECSGPMPWEKSILQDVDIILDDAPFHAVGNMFCWLRLANIMAKHETLIRKRWLKKTQAQRVEILRKAMPGIAPMHRPDMEIAVRAGCPVDRHPRVLESYSYPYINLEDLSKPKSLLIFLNTRGRHLPNALAYSDFELGPLARLRSKLLKETKYTMNFIGTYGGIVENSSIAAAQDSINQGLTMHPIHGFHILMIQWNILDFLFKCCKEILHEIPLESIMSTDPGFCPQEPPPLSDNTELYTSLDVAVREAAYRAPARLDLGRLEGLVSACRNSAEDHIWSLREDPGYFTETVQECREQRMELLKDLHGRVVHTAVTERPLMNKVLRDLITDAYVELYIWDEILSRVSRLNLMAQQYADQLHDISAELPEPFSEAIVETWFFLEATMLDFVEKLHRGWCASPAVRHCFAQDSSIMCKHCITSELVGLDKGDYDMAKLFKLMQFLGSASHRKTLGIHTIVDGIERLLQTNPRAKAMTSSWTASYLSQLSVATECFHQLQLFQPWARKVKHTVELRTTSLFIAYAQSFAKWHNVLSTKFVGKKMYDLGKPGAKFYYPAHKRRTRAHVESMQAAEASLDAFWHAADEVFQKEAGRTPHNIVADIIEQRTLQRTPPWVEPISKTGSASSEILEYISVPISNDSHDQSKQITGIFDRLAITTTEKSKTHGLPTSAVVDKPQEIATPHKDHQQTLVVDKRACKVVKALFHSPLSNDQPGEVAWVDFLHAMVKIGFSTQKLQGSAWQFTPRNLGSEQPIQFHEPHPSPKMPFTWARRIGRRLSRTYGWSGDTFRLA
jgi:hypothetical protein